AVAAAAPPAAAARLALAAPRLVDDARRDFPLPPLVAALALDRPQDLLVLTRTLATLHASRWHRPLLIEQSRSNATKRMPARRLILLVCINSPTTTVFIGAFPALLPELGAAAALADWQRGAVAGAFGLARMVSNVPAGLFITHHLARAF